LNKFTTNQREPTRTMEKNRIKSSLCSCGLWLFLFLTLVSCARGTEKTAVSPPLASDISAGNYFYDVSGAVPIAILQTGEYPLWFRLTVDKPVHIGSIEEAVGTSAFTPWPYAPHIRFLQKENDALVMVINRCGFLKIAPNENKTEALRQGADTDRKGFVMYHFSGEMFRQQYTAGGFVFYENKPAALLYLEDRFMKINIPKPSPAVWSFNMESNNLFPIEIPVFKFFPEEEGWSADTLRKGNDGMFYYRTAKRSDSSASVKMFRTDNLTQIGTEISIDVFYNSFSRKEEISHPSLPSLPKSFVYTEIAEIEDSVFASWEEQHDYSIGAAGFMLIKK